MENIRRKNMENKGRKEIKAKIKRRKEKKLWV